MRANRVRRLERLEAASQSDDELVDCVMPREIAELLAKNMVSLRPHLDRDTLIREYCKPRRVPRSSLRPFSPELRAQIEANRRALRGE